MKTNKHELPYAHESAEATPSPVQRERTAGKAAPPSVFRRPSSGRFAQMILPSLPAASCRWPRAAHQLSTIHHQLAVRFDLPLLLLAAVFLIASAAAFAQETSFILPQSGTILEWPGDGSTFSVNEAGQSPSQGAADFAAPPQGEGEAPAVPGNMIVMESSAAPAISQLVAWGDNSHGQAQVPFGLSNVTAIAAGQHHNLALGANGTVVAWGWNAGGQVNVPSTLSNLVAVAAGGNHSLALRSNGTVVPWGGEYPEQSQVPSGLNNVTALAVGSSHDMALLRDRTVRAWGGNASGQANVPATLHDVIAVAAGQVHSLALRSDGRVVAWGANGGVQTEVPTNLTDVVAIAAGGNHSLALRSDGTVAAWGGNPSGQTDVPPVLSNVVALAAAFTTASPCGTTGRC